MKKIMFMALALCTIGMVLGSCEKRNTPKEPHETYYDAPVRL